MACVSKRRRWKAGAVLLPALALALAAASPAAATPVDAALLSLQGCPAHEFHQAGRSSAADRAAALRDEFEPLPGYPVKLVPPVDWHQNPYRNRTWFNYLHSLRWIVPLLDSYAIGGNRGALAKARDLALDWIARVDGADPSLNGVPWISKTAADRAGRLAYLARAASCEGLLSAEQASTLLDSLRAHGQFLAQPSSHAPHNFGLFVDYGLMLLGHHLPFMVEGSIWRLTAGARFAALLRAEMSSQSGLFLEHSPAYHVLATRLGAAMARLAPGHGIEGLVARLGEAAGWFVMPGGVLAPLGDTAPTPVGPGTWLAHSGSRAQGLLADFESGLGVFKGERSYLAFTAWHHPRPHRHSDDLSFHLRRGGRDVISDSGIHSYEHEGFGEFARTARAHSVLTVDSHDFPRGRERAYGSALRAAGRGAGWIAFAGDNPSVAPLGVSSERLLLYRPRTGLVVVDLARSARRHRYTRRFQVAPGIRAKRARGGWRLRAKRFRGFLAAGPRAGRLRAQRGERDPIAGWAFAGFLKPVRRWTLESHTLARNANLAAGVGFHGRLDARVVRAVGDRVVVRVHPAGRRAYRLVVTQRGEVLRVARAR